MKTNVYTRIARLIHRLAASRLLTPRFEPGWCWVQWMYDDPELVRYTDFATPLDEAKARIRSKLHKLAFEVEMLDPEWEDIPF